MGGGGTLRGGENERPRRKGFNVLGEASIRGIEVQDSSMLFAKEAQLVDMRILRLHCLMGKRL